MQARAPSPVLPERPDVLVARARGGDELAFELIFESLKPSIRRIVVVEQRIPPADVDDILQLVRIDLHRYLPTIDNPAAYLVTAARSRCRKHVRSRQREVAALRAMASLAPSSRSFRRREERLVALLDVRAVIARIGERCAEMVRKVVLRQQTQSDYAEGAGVPLGSVGPTVVRCLRKIRAALCSGGYGGDRA